MYRKTTRLLASVTLSAVLLSGMLTGCGGAAGTTASSSAGASPAATSASASASATPEATPEAAKEPVALTIMDFGIDDAAGAESPIYKQIQEKTNVDLTIKSTPYNGYEDKLNVVMASGDIPDIFVCSGLDNLAQYKRWIADGLVYDLTDNVASYPNLAAQLKKFDALTAPTGNRHYGLPIISYRMTDRPCVNQHVFYVRQDWLDKLGLKVPTTIDEFAAVAKAFAENDPDGNGKRDTYGFSSCDNGIWWMYPIFNAFDSSYERYRKADGKWSPELISDNSKAAVAFLRQLYADKILDPEFMLNTGDKLMEKFIAGKVGMYISNGRGHYNNLYDKMALAYPDKDPKTLFTYTGILAGKNGEKRLDGFTNYWCYTLISNKSADDKKAKALELLDYLASDEGIELGRWGIEGTHYQVDGDKKVPLLPKDDKGNFKNLSEVDPTAKLKYLVTWDADFLTDATPNADEVAKCGAEGIASSIPDPLTALTLDETAAPAETQKVIWEYTKETLVKIIAKSKDFDADWNAFKAAWLEKGGQAVWDETNRKALEENR